MPFPDAVSPRAWGATIDYDTKTWRPWNPDKYVLHYGGDAVRGADDGPGREQAVLRAWEHYHVNSKGWQGIAYNYAIGQSGTLYRLRGENRSGATSGDYEPDGIPENHEARAVVFILGGVQEPSEAALDTFRQMWAADPMPVIGHRQASTTGTLCPGTHLMRFIQGKEYETMSINRDTAVEPNPQLQAFYQQMVDAEVMTPFTQPSGVAFNDEIANFLVRFRDKVMVPTVRAEVKKAVDETKKWTAAKIAAAGGGGATVGAVIAEIVDRLGG